MANRFPESLTRSSTVLDRCSCGVLEDSSRGAPFTSARRNTQIPEMTVPVFVKLVTINSDPLTSSLRRDRPFRPRQFRNNLLSAPLGRGYSRFQRQPVHQSAQRGRKSEDRVKSQLAVERVSSAIG